MFMETPNSLLIATVAAFLLGWVIGRIGGAMKARAKASKRDPRDDRIRSLEAELRVATSDTAKTDATLKKLRTDLADAQEQIERRDNVISDQQAKLSRMNVDLRESVKKTRELRSELSDRAEENVRSEVKLREVETELSVAQASTDLIATGVLDYSLAPEGEPKEDEDKDLGAATTAG